MAACRGRGPRVDRPRWTRGRPPAAPMEPRRRVHCSRRRHSAQGRSRNTSCRFRRNSSRTALRQKRGGARRSNLGAPAPRITRRSNWKGVGASRITRRSDWKGVGASRITRRSDWKGVGASRITRRIRQERHSHVRRTQCERIGSDGDGHLLRNNLAAYDTDRVWGWLVDHPRWTLHFTPKHASWLIRVERAFSILSAKVPARGSFASKDKLRAKRATGTGVVEDA